MEKSLKEKLSYKIFKDVYKYQEICFDKGLCFYLVFDNYIQVSEVISEGSSNYFLVKLIKKLKKLCRDLGKLGLLFAVNIKDRPDLYQLYLKHGAVYEAETGDFVILKYIL